MRSRRAATQMTFGTHCAPRSGRWWRCRRRARSAWIVPRTHRTVFEARGRTRHEGDEREDPDPVACVRHSDRRVQSTRRYEAQRPAPLAVALREPSGSLAQNPSRATGAHQAAAGSCPARVCDAGGARDQRDGRATRARCRWLPARSVSAPCERAGVLRCARQGAGAGRSSRSRSPVLDPFCRVGRRLFPRRSMGAA